MRRIPSLLALVLVVALMAAGCSSDSEPFEVGLGGAVDDAPPLVDDGDDEAGPSEPSTTTVATTFPGTAPATAELWLDPADALLSEGDVGGGWDPPTNSKSNGFSLGPNQTDCDTYWILESMVDSSAVGRLWFQPGANLNHDVYDTGHDTAARIEAAAVDVLVDCPAVTWLEGGSVRISRFDVGESDAVAIEVVSDVGEVTWIAYAVRANLLSRLQRVHFEPGSRPTADARKEFEALVVAMVERLESTPSLPGIGEPPVSTTMPPVLTNQTTLPPITQPPLPSIVLDPDHLMAFALLTDADLGQTDLVIDDTSESIPGDPDDQRFEGCDASESVVDLDAWFTLERAFLSPDGFDWAQLVGRAPSPAEAEAAIADFGLIGQCVPPLDMALAEAKFSGGVLDGIVGGTATWLEIEVDEFVGRLVTYQVDDIVGAVVFSGSVEREAPSLDLFRDLVQAAIDRAS